MALLLLTLFVSASSHPLLEGLRLIHQEVAHSHGHDHPDADHELADGDCQFVSSRDDLQTDRAPGEHVAYEVPALLCLLLQSADDSSHWIDIASSPPPELGATWQFSFRAALPARAPSFAS